MLPRTTWLPAALLFATLLPASAGAYPWTIRYGYTSCAACHVDPSGAGLVTPYGRAQMDLLMTQHYGKKPEEVTPQEGAVFGAVKLPDWLNASLYLRGALLDEEEVTPRAPVQPILMVADVRAAATLGPVHIVATLGFDPVGANLAAITQADYDNLVSREHYVAVDLLDQALVLKAGRMEVPFGLRNIEHTSWVRSETRTDLDSSQQYGVSAAFNKDRVRGELMGIAGNFLGVQDPNYREQGYAGFAEVALARPFTLGLSSLLTTSKKDLVTADPNTLRQAHGVFSRWAVSRPVVLMAEGDLLLQDYDGPNGRQHLMGYAALLQADYELIAGLHLMGSAEAVQDRLQKNGLGVWGTVTYFFFPSMEFRVDVVQRWGWYDAPAGVAPVLTLLGQLHVSL